MKTLPVGNVHATLRWSLTAACREFKTTRERLNRTLSQAGEVPAEDGCFATSQLVRALYGSIQSERQLEVRQRTINWTLRNAALQGSLIDKAMVTRGLEQVIIASRVLIEASSMPAQEKTDLLSNLASMPIVLRETAEKQRKELGAAVEGTNGENGTNGEEAEE